MFICSVILGELEAFRNYKYVSNVGNLSGSKEMLAFLKEDIEKSREPKMGYSSHLSILQRRPTIPICPPSPQPECMVESPQEDHSQPQAPPQLRVIYCIISCLKMQAVLMSVPLIVI